MKKLFTLLITGFFIFVPSLSFAVTCTENCEPTPTNNIEWFDDYLNGKTDNNFNVAEKINERLQESLTNAKAWHSDAYLANFTYLHAPGSMDGYTFTWVSPSNPTKMYYQVNSQSTGEEKDNVYKNTYGIFRVPLTMRKLTKAMLEDKNLLTSLDKIFANQNQTYTGEIKFSLEKNSQNKLMWTITFTDGWAKKVYVVKVDADKIQSPIFSILKGTYVDEL